MSKKTFAVVLASGAAHSILAESFHGEGRDVTFHDDGLSVAHFCGVESVVVQADPAPPSALGALGPLPGSVSAADFAMRATVEIGAINISCTADPAEFAGQIIRAFQDVRVTAGVD